MRRVPFKAALPAMVFVALLAVPAAALAGYWDFEDCDGLPPPVKPAWRSDGSGLDALRSPRLHAEAQRLARCDAALADPALLDAHWRRRAQLLQARALHLLAAGRQDDALRSLADSERVVASRDDTRFAASLADGNRAVRALALIQAGRGADAVAEIRALAAARPYAASLQQLAFRLQRMIDGSVDGELAALAGVARLQPDAWTNIFHLQLDMGRWQAALDVAPRIDPSFPELRRKNWLEIGGRRRYGEIDAVVQRAWVAGGSAYALAALGRQSEADALLATARRQAEDALADAPAAPARGRKTREPTGKAESRAAARVAAIEALDAWAASAAARRAPAAPPLESFMARFGSALADTGMMHEALAAQAGAGREFALARDRALADWEARRREQQQVTADQMLRLLPWPEVEAQTPTFADAARLLSDVKRQAGGFGLARSAETGRTTVRYLHSFAPATTIEEVALLGAARLAEAEGKDSLLVVSRMVIESVGKVYTDLLKGDFQVTDRQVGNVALLLVEFHDAAGVALPPGIDRTRLVPVAEVIAGLSPRYLQPPRAKR